MASASVLCSGTGDLAKQMVASLLEDVAASSGIRNFAVKFWDGTGLALAPEPRFTLVLNHPAVLQTLLDSPSELTLGESFISGDLDVQGDLDCALRLAKDLLSHGPGRFKQAALRGLGKVLKLTPLAPRDSARYGRIRAAYDKIASSAWQPPSMPFRLGRAALASRIP